MSLHELFLLAYPRLEFAAPYVALGGFALAVAGLIVGSMAHRRVRRLTLRRGESLEDTFVIV